MPEGAVPSPCLGLCELAPASLRTVAGEEPREIQLPETRLPVHGDRLLKGFPAGEALARARELGPEGVMDAIDEAGLLGRGGAAFPTAAKWRAVARQPARPHYLVCNADESEPGTFKDRVLMEEQPGAVVEAMAIAMLAADCDKGYVYIRAEYPLAQERMQEAIAASGHDIELRIGAGAYVCGEETALFQSIEGYRGEPRNKPPFPVEVGLFGKPTVVNNVETLVNVPHILLGDTRPTRLFCLSGNVARPGLYERELGTPLRELLDDAGAEPPQAVLLGGAAGTFLGPDELDIALDFNVTLGSGVVMVFGEDADLRGAIHSIAEFFAGGVVRPVRPVPHRHRPPGRGARARRPPGARRARPGDARRVDLRARPDRRERRPVGIGAPVKITIDGVTTEVAEGATILDAARAAGIDTPTLCYGDTLTAVNVCRVCVVELEGARTLVPACSRKARGRDGRAHRLRARPHEPPPRPRAARLGDRPLDRARSAALHRASTTRIPSASARRRRPRRSSTTTSTCAITRSASSVTSASRPAASTTRTRSRSRSPGAASRRASPPSST